MKPVIVIGGGGHARVLIDLVKYGDQYKLVGFTETKQVANGVNISDVPFLGDDEYLLQTYNPESVLLVNGVGSVSTPFIRQKIFDFFKSHHYEFLTLVHAQATIAENVVLGEGSQVMAGAIVQCSSTLGNNSLINTGAIVDHDCKIGPHTHIAPGTTISGGVNIGACVHIGTGASLIQGVKVGDHAIIAAGSVVVRNVRQNSVVMGVPAREKVS